MNRFRQSMAVLSSGVVLTTGVTAASADHRDTTNDHDDLYHYIWSYNLSTNGAYATLEGATEVDTKSEVFVDVNATTHIDVKVYHENLYGYLGRYDCIVYNGSGDCDISVVRYDMNSSDTSKWKALGCHEIGHSVGITERAAASWVYSCQENPLQTAYSDHHDLDGHDVLMIDSVH